MDKENKEDIIKKIIEDDVFATKVRKMLITKTAIKYYDDETKHKIYYSKYKRDQTDKKIETLIRRKNKLTARIKILRDIKKKNDLVINRCLECKKFFIIEKPLLTDTIKDRELVGFPDEYIEIKRSQDTAKYRNYYSFCPDHREELCKICNFLYAPNTMIEDNGRKICQGCYKEERENNEGSE